jgi:hypothetical protein
MFKRKEDDCSVESESAGQQGWDLLEEVLANSSTLHND